MPPPLKIDSVYIASPLILAPLAGFSDLAFRMLCREFGAGLCVSEMISCHGVVRNQAQTLKLLTTADCERPVAFQLFGADPAIMAEAAAMVSALSIDLLDINMGCPAKKVIRKGAGAALLKDLKLAATIISRVAQSSRAPVMVKTRIGLDSSRIVVEDFARMAEDSGVRAITVHARTFAQGFSGRADRHFIELVKKAVHIPVIGNGDVSSYEDALSMIAATGCDGVMIGRGALGNPWIFSPTGTPTSLGDRLSVLKRHLSLIALHFGKDYPLGKAKNHSSRYFRGLHNGAEIRKKIFSCQDLAELSALVDAL
ncbi:MAG: tRNA dihydrouridine synthase DusB, partial [Desulfobacterales bacterium]|nr:tRNA dihydrouridine synthase DusB [Desulfobacterales bacterium]